MSINSQYTIGLFQQNVVICRNSYSIAFYEHILAMGSSNGMLVAFHILCLTVTFSMMVYGTVKYLADESTSIVDAKLFHATEEDIYPTFTICLEIDDKKFDQSML